MSIVEPSFWKYLTLDEDGCVNGIREDAPEEEKEAYKNFLKEEEILKKQGILR
ncbi:hypothetical protein [Anaerovibrio lipolyticus]|uniref:hypothetical protein n=1 Tax=Anaerovibrio lipolyticus TaxID=82374 RepID=UPI0026F32D0D|nr:hypothetical protein [Anaerovibrio lipolyticus]